jgi:hypothetical protein
MLYPTELQARQVVTIAFRPTSTRSQARHADGDVADAGPGVEPGPERPERAVVRRTREPGEAECCSQELAALVENGSIR